MSDVSNYLSEEGLHTLETRVAQVFAKKNDESFAPAFKVQALEDSVEAIVNRYSSKNLNAYPYNETTKTEGGITFTDLGDGRIKIGSSSAQTATTTASFYIHKTADDVKLINGLKYAMSGTPENGSMSSFYLALQYKNTPSTVSSNIYDIGEGNEFTVTTDGDSNSGAYAMFIVIISGSTIPAGGIIFEPMICDVRIKDSTWVPYAKTNYELTQDVSELNSKLPVWVSAASQATHAISPTSFTLIDNGYEYHLFGSYLIPANNTDDSIELSTLPKTARLQSDMYVTAWDANAKMLNVVGGVFEVSKNKNKLYLKRSSSPGYNAWYAGNIIIPHN